MGHSSPYRDSDPSLDLNTLYYRQDGDTYTPGPHPRQSLRQLINAIKHTLQDRSLFSRPSCNKIINVYCGPSFQNGQLSCVPRSLPPPPFDIEDELDLPSEEFGIRPPLQVRLSYTPPFQEGQNQTDDGCFHCWSLYISQKNDSRFSRMSPLYVPSLSNLLIARARIHPLALCSANDYPIPFQSTLPLGTISYLMPIQPTRSSLLFELLEMSLEEEQPITALPACPQTCEAPQWLQDSSRASSNELLLAAKDNSSGYWIGLAFVEVDTTRQVRTMYRIQVVKPEDSVCPSPGTR